MDLIRRQAGHLVLPFKHWVPKIDAGAFVAPTATIIGDVAISEGASVWYGAVLRGDVAPIFVGRNTNIQDGSIVHVSRDLREGTYIGSNVTIGHQALVHACRLEDGCLVGMKACVMDRAVVETGGWVAAGAVVAPGKVVRGGQLWAGVPARHIRDLTEHESRLIAHTAALYTENGREHALALQDRFESDSPVSSL
jgi:gamma-carbonic anhydrase